MGLGSFVRSISRGVSRFIGSQTGVLKNPLSPSAWISGLTGGLVDIETKPPELPPVAGTPAVTEKKPPPPAPPAPPVPSVGAEAERDAAAALKYRRRTLLSGFEGINEEAPTKKKRLLGE